MVICFKKVHTGLVDNMKAGGEAECTPQTEQLLHQHLTGCSKQENHCDLTETSRLTAADRSRGKLFTFSCISCSTKIST